VKLKLFDKSTVREFGHSNARINPSRAQLLLVSSGGHLFMHTRSASSPFEGLETSAWSPTDQNVDQRASTTIRRYGPSNGACRKINDNRRFNSLGLGLLAIYHLVSKYSSNGMLPPSRPPHFSAPSLFSVDQTNFELSLKAK
jgi:hypothetical protein